MDWPLDFDVYDARPTLVLLHAFPFDRRIWEPAAEGLADAAQVLTVDLPGFGGSRAVEAPADLDAWADAVEALLERLVGDEPVVLGGLSMGGYVALRLAARHPARLEALVLCDTRAGDDSAEGRAGRDRAIATIRADGLAPWLEELLPRLLGPEPAPALVGRLRALALEQSPEAVCAALAAMRDRPDSTGVLQDLRVPTLVVVGTEDGLTPPAEARAMAATVAHGWLVTLPGVGHLAPAEAPAELAAAVAGFLRTL